MDIYRFKNILEAMKNLGINECAFTPRGEKTRVSAIENKTHQIGICCDLEDLEISKPMGVLHVPSMLSRIQLFDVEKAGATLNVSSDDSFISNFTLKQGRRVSRITTTDPEMLQTPVDVPPMETIASFEFDEEFVGFMDKASRSIAATPGGTSDAILIISSVSGTDFEFQIKSGDDVFVEHVDSHDDITHTSTCTFSARQFMTAVKQSVMWSTATENKTAIFELTSLGHAVVSVGEMSVFVLSDDAHVSELD